MQKKNGISLIALVITIIVMIILAASVIISMSNTGIIDRANQAVGRLTDKDGKIRVCYEMDESLYTIHGDKVIEDGNVYYCGEDPWVFL